MNELLRINQDTDIVVAYMNGIRAEPKEVDAFIDGEGPPPGLDPMRPDWEWLNSPWNVELTDLFVEDLIKKDPRLNQEAETISAHFEQRLQRLCTMVNNSQPQSETDSFQAAAKRNAEKRERTARMDRRRARRNSVSLDYIFSAMFFSSHITDVYAPYTDRLRQLDYRKRCKQGVASHMANAWPIEC